MNKMAFSSPSPCTHSKVSGSRKMGEPLLPRRASRSDERPTAECSTGQGEKRYCRTALTFLIGVGMGTAGALALVQTRPEVLSGSKAAYSIEPAPSEVPAAYLAARPINNSCLVPKLPPPPGPQTFDACEFVIRSTDEVWNTRGDVDAAIDKYFVDGYYNAGSWGRRGIGKDALKQAVYGEMRAFPDIQIHITDCSCVGNDIDGYKCMMPDILEGTNTGPSAWGPATNRYARWTGLVESFVKQNEATGQWQYVAEWGVHDEWALIAQLGLDFDKVPHPPANTEPFHDCDPLLALGQQALDQPDSAQFWASYGQFHV